MNRIDEARKILGDDYVIVPIEQWNKDVEDYKALKAKLEQAEKALSTAYDYIKQTDQELLKRHLRNSLQQIL